MNSTDRRDAAIYTIVRTLYKGSWEGLWEQQCRAGIQSQLEH